MKPPTYYETLGVPPDVGNEGLKKAYRKKAKEHHSDKGGDDEEMRRINAAFEVLSDPDKRAAYDASGCDPEFEGKKEDARLTVFMMFREFAMRGMPPGETLEGMRSSIRMHITSLLRGNETAKKEIQRLSAFIGKINSTNGEQSVFGENPFDRVTRQLIKDQEELIIVNDKGIKIGEEMLAILAEYVSASPSSNPHAVKTWFDGHYQHTVRENVGSIPVT